MPKTNLNNGVHRVEKRKSIRLKNLWNRLVDRKKAQIQKESKPKGVTVTGKAKDKARRVEYGEINADTSTITMNQRKRRKLERQTGIRKR